MRIVSLYTNNVITADVNSETSFGVGTRKFQLAQICVILSLYLLYTRLLMLLALKDIMQKGTLSSCQ